MHCEACGALVNATWANCLRCGAAIARQPAKSPLRRLLDIVSLRGARELPGGGGQPALAIAGAVPRHPLGVLPRSAGRLTGRWIAAGAAVVLVALAGGAFFGRSLTEPVGVRTPPVSAEAQQLAALQTDARLANETIASLRSELQTARDGATAATDARSQLELRITQAEQELASLNDQLTKANAQVEEQQQVTAVHLQQLAALKECLSGYLVAIELGRQDSWNAANRALATVGDACTQARQVP
jgi:hypothetical protein